MTQDLDTSPSGSGANLWGGDLDARVAALLAAADATSVPLYLARKASYDADIGAAPSEARAWADAIGFHAEAGVFALAPGADGSVAAALVGVGDAEPIDRVGALPYQASPLVYELAGSHVDQSEAALEWLLGAYRFTRYREAKERPARLKPHAQVDLRRLKAVAAGVYFARDLVNTPASDMGPADLSAAAQALAATVGGSVTEIVGDDLIRENYPMIHAVGRAGDQEPRLIDLTWGRADAPKVTLVGKGVCFDTGGLDIKPPRAMRLMKKDMGGAAATLGLARMIATQGLDVRLRVLIPAVENSISDESFRPGDVLTSRKGVTVEIGDTDAEGRLVLADALTTADAEAPDLLIDLATLTGAARVALGPEVAPFYTTDDALAADIHASGAAARDPLWRMPLYKPYDADLSSKIADLSNVSTSGFAGSITAALFLKRFVSKAKAWAHFDIYAWNPKTRPGRPEGGECSAARALFHLLERRYGGAG